jgi:enediyne biosynthesis protein E4
MLKTYTLPLSTTMLSMPKTIAACLLLLAVAACNSNNNTYTPPADALFLKMDAAVTGIDFSNNVQDGAEYNILTYRNFYNGGGVATGDINNDGLIDVFLTANLGESKLYLNKGNFSFTDITASTGIKSKRGWRTGVTMADVNADGWLDICMQQRRYKR